MGKLESLQVGRGAAVLSVLLFHLLGMSVQYQHGYFAYPWIEVLRAGVDVFFVISGVVMVATTYRTFGQGGAGKRFLIHRVSRIYPPYLFLTAILTVLWLVRPDAVNSKTGVDLFSSYTLWPQVDGFPLLQVGWTLSYEMMFYLVFIGMIVYVKKHRLPIALMLWSFAIIAGCTAIALDSSGTIVTVFPRAKFLFSPYVLEFVAGCFIGLCSMKVKLTAGRVSTIVAVILFIVEAAVFEATNFDGNRRPQVLRVLLYGPPAALLIYGLVAWERETQRLNAPRWIVRCGDISYSIYLVHLLVIHFAYRYFWHLFDPSGLRPLFLVVTTGAAIAASVAFYTLAEGPFSRWTRTRLEGIFKVPPRMAMTPSSVTASNSPITIES